MYTWGTAHPTPRASTCRSRLPWAAAYPCPPPLLAPPPQPPNAWVSVLYQTVNTQTPTPRIFLRSRDPLPTPLTVPLPGKPLVPTLLLGLRTSPKSAPLPPTKSPPDPNRPQPPRQCLRPSLRSPLPRQGSVPPNPTPPAPPGALPGLFARKSSLHVHSRLLRQGPRSTPATRISSRPPPPPPQPSGPSPASVPVPVPVPRGPRAPAPQLCPSPRPDGSPPRPGFSAGLRARCPPHVRPGAVSVPRLAQGRLPRQRLARRSPLTDAGPRLRGHLSWRRPPRPCPAWLRSARGFPGAGVGPAARAARGPVTCSEGRRRARNRSSHAPPSSRLWCARAAPRREGRSRRR